MRPEQWQQVSGIFHGALAEAPEAPGLPPLIPDSRQKWNSGSKGCLFDWQTVPFGGVIRSAR